MPKTWWRATTGSTNKGIVEARAISSNTDIHCSDEALWRAVPNNSHSRFTEKQNCKHQPPLIRGITQRKQSVMKNVTTSVKGSILTIQIDLSKPGSPSASGKSLVLGSTEGNVSVPGFEDVKLGVNCYRAA